VKHIREYPWFEKVALLFIPLALSNALYGDWQLALGGGLTWTIIWLWIRRRNRRARSQGY